MQKLIKLFTILPRQLKYPLHTTSLGNDFLAEDDHVKIIAQNPPHNNIHSIEFNGGNTYYFGNDVLLNLQNESISFNGKELPISNLTEDSASKLSKFIGQQTETDKNTIKR